LTRRTFPNNRSTRFVEKFAFNGIRAPLKIAFDLWLSGIFSSKARDAGGPGGVPLVVPSKQRKAYRILLSPLTYIPVGNAAGGNP